MKSSSILKQQLQTIFPIPQSPIWNTPSEMVFLGSCFSNEISKLFSNHFLPVTSNPFGTIFSPIAIANIVHHCVNSHEPNIVQFQNNYHALLYDSSFQNQNKLALIEHIQKVNHSFLNALKKSSTIFVTLGSAWVYQYLESNDWVGNCHKIPQNHFYKKLIPKEDIILSLTTLCNDIRTVNSNCKIIFTISPVRHLRDGISENLLSKSTLIVALHEFLQHDTDILYFPSYEIFTEELKDHRFYKNDLAHPNDWSIGYIFSRLIETFGTNEFQNYLDVAQQTALLLNHKPKSNNELELKKLNLQKEEKKSLLLEKYPMIIFPD